MPCLLGNVSLHLGNIGKVEVMTHRVSQSISTYRLGPREGSRIEIGRGIGDRDYIKLLSLFLK